MALWILERFFLYFLEAFIHQVTVDYAYIYIYLFSRGNAAIVGSFHADSYVLLDSLIFCLRNNNNISWEIIKYLAERVITSEHVYTSRHNRYHEVSF